MDRAGIFVSYSKKDRVWKDALYEHIEPVIRDHQLPYFDDQMIRMGENWDREIQDALASAKIIIAIVSHNFFRSKYIFTKELPQVLEKANNEGAKLIQVVVRPCDIPDNSGLNLFQAAHDRSKPLSIGDEHYHDTVFSKISSEIRQLVANFDAVAATSERKLQKEAISSISESPESTVDSIYDANKLGSNKSVGERINSEGNISSERVQVLLDNDIALAMSKREDKFLALKEWIENSLSEWKRIDDKVNSYEVRIKSVDSIIKKIDKLRKLDPTAIKSDEDIFNHIKDIVGARILAYTPSQIMSLHIEVMSHPRFIVEEVTVHHNEQFSTSVIENIVKLVRSTSDDIKLVSKITESGYTAVHYVIKPDPIDNIYRLTPENCLFDSFELQLRTVVQHAWSETEHRVIYKGNMIIDRRHLQGKFEILANVINHADKLLDQLTQESLLTPSRTHEIKHGNKSIVIESIEFVKRVDFESREDFDPFLEAEEFTRIYKNELYEIFKSGDYTEKLTVAEVYLKGTLFNRARRVYRNLLDKNYENEELYNWAILRYIEASDALAKSDIEHWVGILGERLLDIATINPNDRKLYLSGSVFSWKYDFIDVAIELGEKLLESMGSAEPKVQLKIQCNQLYFLLEKALDNDRDLDDTSNFLSDLLDLQGLENRIMDLQKDAELELAENHLDTLGWYYYYLAIAHLHTDNNIAQDFIVQAKKMFDDLHEKWDGTAKAGTASLWLYHKSEIETQYNRMLK